MTDANWTASLIADRADALDRAASALADLEDICLDAEDEVEEDAVNYLRARIDSWPSRPAAARA